MEPRLALHWTHRALADLARIADYVARDKPAAASDLVKMIRAKTENLRILPYMGRTAHPGTYELLFHRSYLLTYRIKPGRVEILQVWNTAQLR
jgi:plasmid stabilization system protein ParE